MSETEQASSAPRVDSQSRRAAGSSSPRRKLLLWGALLLLAGLYEASCGFSGLDIKASVLRGCAVLKNALRRSQPDEDVCVVSHASDGTICLHPSSVASIAPRWLGLAVVQLGPIWIWLPLLVWLLTRLRQSGETSRGGGASVSPASSQPNHGHRPHHHRSRALAIHFAPVMVAAIAAFLSLINMMRFALRVPAQWNPSKFDPSGHVFVFGLQLIPLWLLVDLRERLYRPASFSTLQLLVFRFCFAVEAALWLLSLTTSAFFHTAAEVFAAFIAVAVLALFCEKVIISALLRNSPPAAGSGGYNHASLAKLAAPLSSKILRVAAALWALSAAASYYLATRVSGSTIRADLLPSHFAFDAVVLCVGGFIVLELNRVAKANNDDSSSRAVELPASGRMQVSDASAS